MPSQETHVSAEEVIPIPAGYCSIPHCRQISGNGRYFGGFLILARKCISKGLKFGKNFDVDALQITMLKHFFGTKEDKMILFTYASPQNSCYTTSRHENIFDKIETEVGNDNLIIMGDLNGRTCLEEDFVRDSSDDHSPINTQGYVKDTPITRQNCDPHSVDQQGKRILELSKNMSLRILNGRTPGDMVGNFTRFPSNTHENPSTIDYALCSVESMIEIKSFTVLPFTGLSDHCCISMNIMINSKIYQTESQNGIPQAAKEGFVHPLTYRYTFDNNRKHIFKHNLLSNRNIDKIGIMLSHQTELTTIAIDNCIGILNEVLIASAKKSFAFKKVPNKIKPRRHKSKNWFTKESKARRTVLRQRSKALSS